ncbi:MAG: hypothetical protein R3C18_27230 [Planctomycetaceae bacterium]
MKRVRWGAACLAALGMTTAAWAQEGGPADLFSKLDTNKDGKLEASEISEEQTRFFERMVRVGDKNEDGVLTLDEFQSASTDQTAPSAQPGPGRGPGGRGPGGRGPGGPPFGPEQIMERFDKNKDGKLTRDELPEDARERMGRMFDAAGKDELTAEDIGKQFRAGMERGREEFVKRMDRNNDGKLSRDEIPEPMRARMGRMFDELGTDEVPIDRVLEIVAQGEGRPEGGRPPGPPRDGARPVREDGAPPREFRPEGGPPRDGDRPRPEGAPRDGERRPEGGPPREGDRPGPPREGERPPGPPRGPREGEGGPMFRGPALMQILDKNKDGQLSREELAAAAEAFGELDRNDDGQLDMRELMGGPPQGFGPGQGPGFGRGPFAGRPPMEGDGPPPRDGFRPPREGDGPRPEGAPRDGDRPRPEAGEGRNGYRPPRDGDRPRPEGAPRDGERRPEGPPRDGDRPRPEGPPRDGDRPRPEGAPRDGERRPEGGPPRDGDRPRPPFSADEAFGRMDQDKDGFISQEEAPERMRENFGRIDANGDKKISKEELAEAFRAMQGRRPPGGEGRPRPEGQPEGERPRRPDAE